MGKRINILFLVSTFEMGGVEKVNIRMINGIDKERFNVHVLYIKEGMLMEEVQLEKVKLSKLGDKNNLKSLETIKYIFKVAKYVKQNKIDVIHSIDPMFYAVGATAAKLTNIRHVRTQPNFVRRHEKLNTKTMKVLPFAKWTDKFIAFQFGSARDLELAGVEARKIEVISGFLEPEKFLFYDEIKDIRSELNIPSDNKIILALHRMVENKGYETFIAMIPYIVQEYKKVTFLLVGDGPLKKLLEELVRKLGVADYVVFTGFRKDIANIVKQIDFGVYPLADTAGMTSVIYAGKVLITRKNSSMDEFIIDGETGYLVPDDRPETYAEYSLMLLKNQSLLKRMEEKQKEFVLKNFNGIESMKKLENIFFSLCEENVNKK